MSDELRWYREKFDPFVLMGMEGFFIVRVMFPEKSNEREKRTALEFV